MKRALSDDEVGAVREAYYAVYAIAQAALERGKAEIEVGDIPRALQAQSDFDKAVNALRSLQRLDVHAFRGMRFTNNERGLSRLYREAEAILGERGAETSAHDVRLELVKKGVIRLKQGSLHWTDDRKKSKETTVKQFETGLSRLRRRFR
jgi:hypothetical protein